jgi:hypothetical protein
MRRNDWFDHRRSGASANSCRRSRRDREGRGGIQVPGKRLMAWLSGDVPVACSRHGRGSNTPRHLTVFNRPPSRVRFLGGKRRGFKVPVII